MCTQTTHPHAILLDFDGTIVDSEPLHYRCWMETVRPYGVSVSWEEYQRDLVGINDLHAGRILLSQAFGPDSGQLEELAQQACETKRSAYRQRLCADLSIAAPTRERILKLSSKALVAVVSSSLTPEVEPLLLQEGLRAALDALVCGEHVARLKPDPEPYLLALKLLNARADGGSLHAGQCLVFEDSSSGIAAARAAGMTVHRVSSPEELPSLIEEHLSDLLR